MRNFSHGTSDNPQNVENAKIMPNASFSPSQAVQVQLDAVAKNDDPWFNHGIQTMYEFAEDTGSMERSWYFVTLQKDLYHFDHFMGGFSTRLGPLIGNTGYTILEPKDGKEVAPGMLEMNVAVTDANGGDAGVFSFHLVRRELGVKKGAWMTKSLCRQSDRQRR